MTTRRITMGPEDAREFVRVATDCDFDVDVAYNHYTVDAKSILGVLGLDFKQILTVRYSGFNADFEKFLSRFAIAC